MTTVEQLLLIVDRAERGSMLAEEAVLLRAGIRRLAREAREGACTPISRPNSPRGSTGTTGTESASEAHSRSDPQLRPKGDDMSRSELPELRAELDQLNRDCDARDETIRHLDAGLTRERERVAGLEAELVGVRSVVDRVRTLATQMRDWYEPRSVVSGWGRQALEALDASPAASPQVVVDETPAEAAQAADLPTVIHRTPDQLRQQRAELIASTGLDETVLRERGETFQLYPEHADAWQTVQGIDYLLAGENGGEA